MAFKALPPAQLAYHGGGVHLNWASPNISPTDPPKPKPVHSNRSLASGLTRDNSSRRSAFIFKQRVYHSSLVADYRGSLCWDIPNDASRQLQRKPWFQFAAAGLGIISGHNQRAFQ